MVRVHNARAERRETSTRRNRYNHWSGLIMDARITGGLCTQCQSRKEGGWHKKEPLQPLVRSDHGCENHRWSVYTMPEQKGGRLAQEGTVITTGQV